MSHIAARKVVEPTTKRWNPPNKSIYEPHDFGHGAAFLGQACMEHRPLTLGLAGGSLSSFAWRFFSDLVDSPFQPAVPSPVDCICPTVDYLDWDIDFKSVSIGILVGIALGPLLEALLVVRQWWSNLVRRQLAAVTRSVRPLYRELSRYLGLACPARRLKIVLFLS